MYNLEEVNALKRYNNTKNLKQLKIRQAAEMLGVNPETLRRWDKSGKLKAIIISERGDRRYKKEDIEQLVKKLVDRDLKKSKPTGN